ncbi:membrane protein [Candidatus Magnetobacterium bavaricum]|uniref:Membrane protein n=1 Tax=Candidatus Magnetobacterium bavaricum TaxID=29290 RepID=A0A0F3GQE2_9BACT|nr:membrane protein [Candidatus Magnetobacterium bavaricum]
MSIVEGIAFLFEMFVDIFSWILKLFKDNDPDKERARLKKIIFIILNIISIITVITITLILVYSGKYTPESFKHTFPDYATATLVLIFIAMLIILLLIPLNFLLTKAIANLFFKKSSDNPG